MCFLYQFNILFKLTPFLLHLSSNYINPVQGPPGWVFIEQVLKCMHIRVDIKEKSRLQNEEERTNWCESIPFLNLYKLWRLIEDATFCHYFVATKPDCYHLMPSYHTMAQCTIEEYTIGQFLVPYYAHPE